MSYHSLLRGALPIESRRFIMDELQPMNLTKSRCPAVLNARQQILRRKMEDQLDKVLRLRPLSAHTRYAHLIATDREWTILEQLVRELPYALRQLISLHLRDQGNALIEETRHLNNRFVGHSYRDIEAILSVAPDCQDLRTRIIEWGEEVAAQVVYKLRNRAKQDPLKTFDLAYRSIVCDLDTRIVHGSDRMYMLVWSVVVDMLPYKLMDAFLLQPGYIEIRRDARGGHTSTIEISDRLPKSCDASAVIDMFDLYGVEPASYVDNMVLKPLLTALASAPTLPGPCEQRERYQAMLADLLEAAPYLVSSIRTERFIFSLPGSARMAAFCFVPGTSCASILFADDTDSLLRAARTAFSRGGLMLGYDGQLSTYMHPWRTLDKVFGEADGQLLGYWLLQQIHGRVVQDYLKIEHYFLDTSESLPDDAVEIAEMDETLAYIAFAKASDRNKAGTELADETSSTQIQHRPGAIAQLRRRHFFKLLARCGVSIEQGKGSEIKLLRAGWHPFRLGNHYGNNPTIPSFLAMNILKRLGISHDEWLDSVAAA